MCAYETCSLIVVFDAQHFGRVLGRLRLQHLIDDRAVADAQQRADEPGVRGRRSVVTVVPVVAVIVVRRRRRPVVSVMVVLVLRRRRRRRRTPGPGRFAGAVVQQLLMIVLAGGRHGASVLFGYVPDHAVLEREPALARLARERLFLGVGAHVPAQVLGRVEPVQAERAQHLQIGTETAGGPR